jgi:ferritin-like metal-binding protein YciE
MNITAEIDLFVWQLKELYSIEKQLLIAEPNFIKDADSDKLKTVLKDHLDATHTQFERLENIAIRLDNDLSGEDEQVIKTLISTGGDTAAACGMGPIRDFAIMCGADKIEHFETACYKGAIYSAKKLGEKEIEGILSDSLKEEEAAKKIIEALSDESLLSSIKKAMV